MPTSETHAHNEAMGRHGQDIGNRARVEIEALVLCVLQPDALSQWWRTPIPALHNATPDQVLRAGDVDRLIAYVRTYQDGAFS